MGVSINTILFPSLSFSSVLLTFSFILWLTYWYISRRHLFELGNKIPGPPGLPLIGNALDFRGNSSDIFSNVDKISKNYNKIFKIWLGPRLMVFLKKPEDIELILSSHVHLDKSEEYDILRPWLGNGLLTSTGRTWRTHRKLIAPTFHTSVLKSFIEAMNKNSKITVRNLRQLGSKTFDCHEFMCEATVDILLETVMGVENVGEENESMNYAVSVIKLNDIVHFRQTKPWLKPDLFFNFTNLSINYNNLLNTVHNFSSKIFNRKKDVAKKQSEFTQKEEIEELQIPIQNEAFDTVYKDDLDMEESIVGEKKRKPFLESLIESFRDSKVISEKEIKEQVDTLLFEGHDTTGAGSSFFLSLMGIFQNVQEKIIEELYNIFGDSDRPATFADTLEMKYLERCILETLRLYPPVPVIARRLRQDLKMASGNYVIPAGCTVTIGIFWMHRDPDIFPNPDKFNPDHHLPENAAKRNYFSFIPFSAGPRSCVGRKYAMLKLKILLSTILRNFHVYSDYSESDFKLQGDIILKRAEGFQIRLKPRKSLFKK